MVTDIVSILASVGGALGLCLGFSIWGGFNTGSLEFVDILHIHAKSYLILMFPSGLNMLGSLVNKLKGTKNEQVSPITEA